MFFVPLSRYVYFSINIQTDIYLLAPHVNIAQRERETKKVRTSDRKTDRQKDR